VEELAPDPDHGFNVPDGAIREAEVAEDLEFRGIFDELKRPLRPQEGDFIDQNGVHWDVKGYQDTFPNGGFTLQQAEKDLVAQNRDGFNIVFDTRMLSDENTRLLEDLVNDNGWNDRVVWYPPRNVNE
jgi:hypothetical protein